MEDPKAQFLRQVAEQEAWLEKQPGVIAYYPSTRPECTLTIVTKAMPDLVRQAIRDRFGVTRVVFQEGNVTVQVQRG